MRPRILVVVLVAVAATACSSAKDNAPPESRATSAKRERDPNPEPPKVGDVPKPVPPPASALATAPPTFGKPHPRRRATVKAAQAEGASGRLSMADVESAIDSSFDEFSKCSEEDATITVRALVAPSGKVIQASSPRSTPDDPRLRDCIVAAFRALSFPTASGGAPAPLAVELAIGEG
ncbi:MAG: hypothetical protein U0414_13860 [Polyangiaceae bacterium]